MTSAKNFVTYMHTEMMIDICALSNRQSMSNYVTALSYKSNPKVFYLGIAHVNNQIVLRHSCVVASNRSIQNLSLHHIEYYWLVRMYTAEEREDSCYRPDQEGYYKEGKEEPELEWLYLGPSNI